MWIMDDGDNKGILAINGQRGDPCRGRQDPGDSGPLTSVIYMSVKRHVSGFRFNFSRA